MLNRILNKDSWLSIREVMDLTTLSDSTIRRHIRMGRLPVSKTTGKILIPYTGYQEWLTQTHYVNGREVK